jgi:hypothetical protein
MCRLLFQLPAYVAASLVAKPPSVTATKVSPSQRFIRANRGRRNNLTIAVGTAAVTAMHVSNQEERLVRPPPNA